MDINWQKKNWKQRWHFGRGNSEIKRAVPANMSHEIRTPMNGIIDWRDFCLTPIERRTTAISPNRSKVCSDNLLVIINDILDLSKSKQEKYFERFIPFRSCPTRSGIIPGQKQMRNRSQLVTKLDSQLAWKTLCGDLPRPSQILNNLMSNATKSLSARYVRAFNWRSKGWASDGWFWKPSEYQGIPVRSL